MSLGKRLTSIFHSVFGRQRADISHPCQNRQLKIQRCKLSRKQIEQKIELNHGALGLDLSFSDVIRSDLSNMNLRGARLAECNFYLSNFTGSILANCDLRNTHFHDAILDDVDFYLADLENAHLIGASLKYANLNRTNLTNTRLPDRIQEALGGKLLQEDERKYEEYFSKIAEFVPEDSINHRRVLRFAEAANIYRTLKNNLMSAGRYDEASWAYIRERQLRRKALAPWRVIKMYNVLLSSNSSPVGSIWVYVPRAFLIWIGDWLAELSCGYGEKPFRTLLWSGLTILFFTTLYQWVGGIDCQCGKMNFLDYANYSLGSFSTIGFSQFEATTPIAQTLTSVEALIGIAMLALLMFALGNRIGRS